MSTIKDDAGLFAKTLNINPPIAPREKQLHRDFERRCDCGYHSGDLEGVIEIQKLTFSDATGGVFDMTFQQPANGGLIAFPEVDTATVAWDATAQEMQDAIDAVAAGSWPKYQPGDIAVTGGPAGVGGADIFFTFSGISVHGRNISFIADNGSLTGGAGSMVRSVIATGHHARFWFAALKLMGVISGTDPAFSDTPNGQYTIHQREDAENYPGNETIKRLVREASAQEHEDWETEILVPLNIPF